MNRNVELSNTMKIIPTTEAVKDAQTLDVILNSLTHDKCFALFQASIDKCPATITKLILTPYNLYDKVHHEEGARFSSIVEKQLVAGLKLHFKIVNGSSGRRNKTTLEEE